MLAFLSVSKISRRVGVIRASNELTEKKMEAKLVLGLESISAAGPGLIYSVSLWWGACWLLGGMMCFVMGCCGRWILRGVIL